MARDRWSAGSNLLFGSDLSLASRITENCDVLIINTALLTMLSMHIRTELTLRLQLSHSHGRAVSEWQARPSNTRIDKWQCKPYTRSSNYFGDLPC